MASVGKNMRITVGENERERTRKLFTEVLGAKAASPKPDLEVYIFEDGFSLGAYYVNGPEVLGKGDHMKAPWLEFLVDDPSATEAELAKLDIRPFEYADRSHAYFCPPSGPVFRLANRRNQP